MKNVKMLVLIGCIGFCLSIARADESDQKTTMTFSTPVELPGIVLPAGTYVFRVLDRLADDNVLVEVLSQDEQKVRAIVRAIPDYDYEGRPSGETVMTFEERSHGTPQAIKAWFFPGNNYGYQFVYSEASHTELAKAEDPPAPFASAEDPEALIQPTSSPEEQAMEMRPLGQQQEPLADVPPDEHQIADVPSQEEQQMADVPSQDEQLADVPPQEGRLADVPSQEEQVANFDLQEQRTEQAQAAQPEPVPTRAAMIQALPKTASPVPLIGLAGMLSLAGSLVLRSYSKREWLTRSNAAK